MFRRSLLASSRQLWKLYLSLILVISGAFLVFLAVVYMEQLTPGSGFLLLFVGFSVAAIGFLAGSLFVKCPKCGAKLLWKAVSEAPASRWLHWLLTLSQCPVCNYDSGAEEHGCENVDRGPGPNPERMAR